jgi:glycosyltransferase involved in cell wall biosynthesis
MLRNERLVGKDLYIPHTAIYNSAVKIIYIISGLDVGGAETALYNLLKGGLSNEFECYVISLTTEGSIGAKIKQLDVPVISLHLKTWTDAIYRVFKLFKIIRSLKPDIVQGWMYHGNLFAYIASLTLLYSPIVTWGIRQSLYDIRKEKSSTQVIIKLCRLISKRANSIIYNSHTSKRQHENFGLCNARSMVIPNGIDTTEYFYNIKGRNKIRKEIGISEQSILIGHVARYHPMKDHLTFIDSAIHILEKYENVYFLLCGRGVNSSDLKDRIPTDYKKKFIFFDERIDIPDIMNAIDLFCQSSWSEAFPNVLGEAMASGTPCVATNVGDSSLIIGDTGFIVDPSDVESLANGISMFLEASTEARKALGIQARKRVDDLFSLPFAVEQYIKQYKFLLQNKRT